MKAEDKIPHNLENYSSYSPNENIEIRDYHFDVTASIAYGSNEGIYVNIYLDGDIGAVKKKTLIGVFKTLYTTDESMRTMGILAADFVSIASAFIDKHIDDFTWKGFEANMYDQTGKQALLQPISDDLNSLIKRCEKSMGQRGVTRIEIFDNRDHKKVKTLMEKGKE